MKLDILPCIFVAVSLVAAAEENHGHNPATRVLSPPSAITPAPAFHGELLKRAPATCGFIRGNSASPLTCDDGYNCITTAHFGAAFACCNSIECLNDWGICQEYGTPENDCKGVSLAATRCSSIYGSMLRCPSASPSCYRFARSSSRGAYATQYSWACGTDTADVLLLATATSAGQDAAALTGASVARTTRSAYSPYYSDYSSSSTTTRKAGLPTRTIVILSLVGGAALFVLIVLAWIFISRRRKAAQIQKASQASNINYYPPQPMPPPPPQQQQQQPVMQPSPMMSSPVVGGGGVVPWNNGMMMHSQSPPPPFVATSPKPQPATPMVHELTAPVRDLHEMPAGHGQAYGGANGQVRQ